MKGLPDFLCSQSALHQSFVVGLEGLLEQKSLGAFILVLANASYHESVYQLLEHRLQQRFAELVTASINGLGDAPDDVAVFKKIMDVGLQPLVATEKRKLRPWSLQYNRLRSFRPARASDESVNTLHAAFKPDGFHFNKAFLQKEVWWQGRLQGRQSRLLYNKFPFADYHGLLVTEPEQNRPQVLSQQAHDFIWQLVESVADRLPGFGVGYNAYGAAASVNHQHFQTCVRQDGGYPIEDRRWHHNGGKHEYPLNCFKETACHDAWQRIEFMHAANTAYNLLYRPGTIYIVPRRFQGEFVPARWMTGMGWSDLAGEFTVIDYEVFERLSAEQFESQLKKAALPSTN
jgi:hypothetical protein